MPSWVWVATTYNRQYKKYPDFSTPVSVRPPRVCPGGVQRPHQRCGVKWLSLEFDPKGWRKNRFSLHFTIFTRNPRISVIAFLADADYAIDIIWWWQQHHDGEREVLHSTIDPHNSKSSKTSSEPIMISPWFRFWRSWVVCLILCNVAEPCSLRHTCILATATNNFQAISWQRRHPRN